MGPTTRPAVRGGGWWSPVVEVEREKVMDVRKVEEPMTKANETWCARMTNNSFNGPLFASH